MSESLHVTNDPIPTEASRLVEHANAVLDEILNELTTSLLPVEEKYLEKDRPLSAMLLDNFRGSFKLSNGSAHLQFLLYARMSDLIHARFDHDSVVASTHETQLNVATFTVPRRHTDQKNGDDSYAVRVQNIWNVCMEVVRKRENLKELQPTSELKEEVIEDLIIDAEPGEIYFAITDLMIERDIIYLQNGRPNRPDDESRYKSLVRDYALLGKPTGATELDFIMNDTGAIIKALASPTREIPQELDTLANTRAWIHKLEEAWYLHHDEPFFPEGTFNQ